MYVICNETGFLYIEYRRSMKNRREFTSQERAMLVAWALCSGSKVTVDNVIQLTGLKPRSARTLLVQAERVLPILKVGKGWRKL